MASMLHATYEKEYRRHLDAMDAEAEILERVKAHDRFWKQVENFLECGDSLAVDRFLCFRHERPDACGMDCMRGARECPGCRSPPSCQATTLVRHQQHVVKVNRSATFEMAIMWPGKMTRDKETGCQLFKAVMPCEDCHQKLQVFIFFRFQFADVCICRKWQMYGTSGWQRAAKSFMHY